MCALADASACNMEKDMFLFYIKNRFQVILMCIGITFFIRFFFLTYGHMRDYTFMTSTEKDGGRGQNIPIKLWMAYYDCECGVGVGLWVKFEHFHIIFSLSES